MKTYFFLGVGVAGLVTNVLIGHLVPASMTENVLGLLVLVSIVLISIGFIPGLHKWPHARIATVVMSIAFTVYIAYHATVVVRYVLNEEKSDPQQQIAP